MEGYPDFGELDTILPPPAPPRHFPRPRSRLINFQIRLNPVPGVCSPLTKLRAILRVLTPSLSLLACCSSLLRLLLCPGEFRPRPGHPLLCSRVGLPRQPPLSLRHQPKDLRPARPIHVLRLVFPGARTPTGLRGRLRQGKQAMRCRLSSAEAFSLSGRISFGVGGGSANAEPGCCWYIRQRRCRSPRARRFGARVSREFHCRFSRLSAALPAVDSRLSGS